jgi:GTP-binding protein HflX
LIEQKKKRDDGPEKAVLIGVITRGQSEAETNEYLDELAFLAETAGAETQRRFIQRLDSPNPSTFIGRGKVDEIKRYIDEHQIDLVIFDDDLSPAQVRNVEKAFEIKVLDRSNLILDIFASRARTAHAKTQVELAQYQYLLPRLTRMWTHLERQKGGIGMRGPGETQIETDRRIIQTKIALLRMELEKIDRQMSIQRANRGELVRVALVGYTNVGKSTLMNILSKSDVFAENKLFATLDTTVRKVVLGRMPFLLSDTVGFIRKLPHQLVESFKSTLDEVREADLLMHVVDLSHSEFEDHYRVVNETLQEIGASDKLVIVVFNKIDAYQPEFDPQDAEVEEKGLEALKRSWMSRMDKDHRCVFISASKRQNLDELREVMYQEVKKIYQIRYPYKAEAF